MSDPTAPTADAAARERRSALLGAKLRGLVADHLGRQVDVSVATYPAGSACLVGDDAWVLLDGVADRRLGGALAWAVRNGADALHLVAERDTGLLARRAGGFGFPINIWFAEGRVLLPAVAEDLEPPVDAPSTHLAVAPLIEAAGATVNVEHGVVFGEVRGLEVCRVVDEPTVGYVTELDDAALTEAFSKVHDPAAGVILEVGVGANDREAFRLLHGDIPTADALRGVVDSVRRVRAISAPQHPLNRMARERFLRWTLEEDPALVDLAELHATQPPVARPSLREAVPCVASGVAVDGTECLVVCSTGVDLDLAPYVADVQRMTDVDVVVALPERDRVPITDELLGLLLRPVSVRTVG